MTTRRRWRIAATAAALLGLTGSAVAAVPPVEAFGRVPTIRGVDFSSNGVRSLSIATVDGKPMVAVMDVDAPSPGTAGSRTQGTP